MPSGEVRAIVEAKTKRLEKNKRRRKKKDKWHDSMQRHKEEHKDWLEEKRRVSLAGTAVDASGTDGSFVPPADKEATERMFREFEENYVPPKFLCVMEKQDFAAPNGPVGRFRAQVHADKVRLNKLSRKRKKQLGFGAGVAVLASGGLALVTPVFLLPFVAGAAAVAGGCAIIGSSAYAVYSQTNNKSTVARMCRIIKGLECWLDCDQRLELIRFSGQSGREDSPKDRFKKYLMYRQVPSDPFLYVSTEQFHQWIKADKRRELTMIAFALGARRIRLVSQSSLSETVGAGASGLGVGAEYTDKSTEFHKTGMVGDRPEKLPNLPPPEKLFWLHKEQSWQDMVQKRKDGWVTEVEVVAEYTKDYGVNAKLQGAMTKFGLLATVEQHKSSREEFLIEFWPREEYVEVNLRNIEMWTPEDLKYWLISEGIKNEETLQTLEECYGADLRIFNKDTLQSVYELKDNKDMHRITAFSERLFANLTCPHPAWDTWNGYTHEEKEEVVLCRVCNSRIEQMNHARGVNNRGTEEIPFALDERVGEGQQSEGDGKRGLATEEEDKDTSSADASAEQEQESADPSTVKDGLQAVDNNGGEGGK